MFRKILHKFRETPGGAWIVVLACGHWYTAVPHCDMNCETESRCSRCLAEADKIRRASEDAAYRARKEAQANA